ncbi:9232_t:CDS:2, partial [Racocetra persica]
NLPSKLYDEICTITSNNYMENDNMGIEFSCLLELDAIDNPHKLSKKIAELVPGSHSFWYYCSQCQTLNKRPRKHKDLEQQRDRDSMERFACEGTLYISINLNSNFAKIRLKHNFLHKRPERFEVDNVVQEHIKKNIYLTLSDIYKQLESNYPDLMQKQVHAWWNKFIKEKYVCDNNNQLNSMKVLLEEYNYSIVLENITEGIKYLGFITPFFNLLLKNKEIVVDATFNIESIEELENYKNSDDDDSDDLYENYELYLTKALEIVREQKAKQNYKWAKSVKSSFAGLQKIVTDIETYKRRTTNP